MVFTGMSNPGREPYVRTADRSDEVTSRDNAMDAARRDAMERTRFIIVAVCVYLVF